MSKQVPRGPHASPGFWLHHAALIWRQACETGLGAITYPLVLWDTPEDPTHFDRHYRESTYHGVVADSGLPWQGPALS
jgi:hypothetical protein